MPKKPFSNFDKNIFLINLESQLDRGALLSRYSRTSSLDIRELYSKEFENNESRGKDFYRRVFLEYGDESVAELVNVQLSIQNISNISAKLIEESRIGLSYLEKSSRYVRYDKKHKGKFLFMNSESIGLNGKTGSDYDDYCNRLFLFYEKNYDNLLKLLREKYPEESYATSTSDREILKKSYDSAIRARALDDLRYVLPASTLTNIGISGNTRAFINLIQKLNASGNDEAKAISKGLYEELEPEYQEIIQSAISKHGMEQTNYRIKLSEISKVQMQLPTGQCGMAIKSDLNEKEAIDKILTNFFYSNDSSYFEIEQYVKNLNVKEKEEVIQKIIDARKNRRDKLPRSFESIRYTVEANLNFGAFRDLQRHRMFTILRKHLTPDFGYDIPSVISSEEAMRTEFLSLMEEAKNIFKSISLSRNKIIAQYTIPFAYKHPVLIHGNFREFAYFIELRSTPQAHYDLRNFSIKLYEEIDRIHPNLSRLIKFCDRGDYPLGRYSQEYRKQQKMKHLGFD